MWLMNRMSGMMRARERQAAKEAVFLARYSCKAGFFNRGNSSCWFFVYRLKYNAPSILFQFINSFVVQIYRISEDFCFAFVRAFGKIIYGGDKIVINPKFHAACFCHDLRLRLCRRCS